MVTESSLQGSVSPRFKPFLRAEPGGRRVDGWSRGPETILHPTFCDDFPVAAAFQAPALRRGSGGWEVEEGGSGQA